MFITVKTNPFILQGRVAFVCDGKWLTAGPGDFVFGPKNIPHGFKVTGTTPAQMLLLVSPGGCRPARVT